MADNQDKIIDLAMSSRFSMIRLALNIGQKKFEERTGIKQSLISAVENGKRNITSDIKIALEDTISVNRKWLETGEGPMFKEHLEIHAPETKYSRKSPGDLPMYPSAGNVAGIDVYSDFKQSAPSFVVNIPQFKDCEFGKMIFGDAMAPKYLSGSYIFCKPVEDKKFIVFGEVYYVEADNFSFIRIIKKGKINGELEAVSVNSKFENFSVDIKKIKKIYAVKGHFQQSTN